VLLTPLPKYASEIFCVCERSIMCNAAPTGNGVGIVIDVLSNVAPLSLE